MSTVTKSDKWVLFLGDSIEIIPEHIESDSIDLCFTSPSPYRYKHQSVGIGSEPEVQDYILNLAHLFDKVKRVLTDDGNLFLNLVDPFGIDLGGLLFIPERIALTMLSRGWICRGKLIWYRPFNGKLNDTKRFRMDWEYLYWFTKNKNSYFDFCNGQYGESSVFKSTESKYFDQEGFPKDLINMLIKSSSRKNGTVLDPLCGTASTGEVALRLGRNFVGIEILEDKFKIAKRNLSQW